MCRTQMHDNKYLTLDKRKIIQAGIEYDSTKVDSVRIIGKDATTVVKEIRKHREFKVRNTFNHPIDCTLQSFCDTKPCLFVCDKCERPSCSRRDKSRVACNKCTKATNCRHD